MDEKSELLWVVDNSAELCWTLTCYDFHLSKILSEGACTPP